MTRRYSGRSKVVSLYPQLAHLSVASIWRIDRQREGWRQQRTRGEGKGTCTELAQIYIKKIWNRLSESKLETAPSKPFGQCFDLSCVLVKLDGWQADGSGRERAGGIWR